MASKFVVADLKAAINRVNACMADCSLPYRYAAFREGGSLQVALYRDDDRLYLVGIGSARECYNSMYVNAFDYMYTSVSKGA